jgi:hypothetical protein
MNNDIIIKAIHTPEQLNEPEEATDYADCFNAYADAYNTKSPIRTPTTNSVNAR